MTFGEAIDFASGATPINPSLQRNENGFTENATLEDWESVLEILGHDPVGSLGGIIYRPRVVDYTFEQESIEKWETAAIGAGLLNEISRAMDWDSHGGRFERNWTEVYDRVTSVITPDLLNTFIIEEGTVLRILWEPEEPHYDIERPIAMAYTIAIPTLTTVPRYRSNNRDALGAVASGVSRTRSHYIFPSDHNERRDPDIITPKRVTCRNCGLPNNINTELSVTNVDQFCQGCGRYLPPSP